ncbi:hypothetical protein SDC9_138794 [bioreactor metagenome]|uniref:Uncharacterized protein n=1 Tax=bioreactor metagenome TaxID=1076179 RepID=A0A645DSL6_9ZZZZ
MCLQHQEFNRLITEFFGDVAGGEEVAEALAHFAVIDVDKTVMHPVAGIFMAGAALALRNFVFMMRENQVAAAAMDVDSLAKMLADHGGALDVPAGAALAPRRLPEGLTGFGGLPEREIKRVLLVFRDVDAAAGFEILNRHVRKLAVLVKFAAAEIDAALRGIREALFLQRFNNADNLVHCLGCLGMHRRGAQP